MPAPQKHSQHKNSVILLAPFACHLSKREGGVGTWTRSILSRFEKSTSLKCVHINTVPPTREDTDLRFWKRITSGCNNGFRIYKELKQAIKEHPDSIVHLCSSASLGLYRDVQLLKTVASSGLPSVVHWRFGRIPELKEKKNWEWRMLLKVCRLATKCIVLDQASYNALQDTDIAPKTIKIPNPITKTTEQFCSSAPSLPQHSARIVFVGHVFPSKGVRELVQACSLIDSPNLELHIIGEYQENFREELVQLSAKKTAQWLKFRGVLPNQESLQEISHSAIFVLPSYTEGFPNSVLEAMALGKAIVATNVGAIPEMLTNDEGKPCGLIIPPKETNALKAAIEKLLHSPQLRENLGYQAQKTAFERYSQETIWKQLKKCWCC